MQVGARRSVCTCEHGSGYDNTRQMCVRGREDSGVPGLSVTLITFFLLKKPPPDIVYISEVQLFHAVSNLKLNLSDCFLMCIRNGDLHSTCIML